MPVTVPLDVVLSGLDDVVMVRSRARIDRHRRPSSFVHDHDHRTAVDLMADFIPGSSWEDVTEIFVASSLGKFVQRQSTVETVLNFCCPQNWPMVNWS